MKPQQPAAVIAIKILSIVNVGLCLATIAFLYWMVGFEPTGPLGRGFREGFVGPFEQNPLLGRYDYRAAALLSLVPILSLIGSTLISISLGKRTQAWWLAATVSTGFFILACCLSPVSSICQIACFVLLLIPSTKNYWSFGITPRS